MPETRLIVNADDFGENAAVNAAIIAAHERGIVTSTSLMVTGEGFEEAVDLARSHPGLAVGLHVVLVHGRPALPAEEIPDLITAAGAFSYDAPMTGVRWFLTPRVRDQIRREIRAQAERFLQTGLPMDHIDAHLHFHVQPAVFSALLEVAEEIGVKRMRLPWEPWPLALSLDASNLLTKVGYALAFGLLARLYRPRLRAAGVFFADAVFGVLQTGRISEEYLVRLIGRLPPGTYEFYAHPRLDSTAGLRELHALISPRVREAITTRGIRLTTYTEAAGG